MPNTCWAPGCKTEYASVDSTGRHLFKVPDDAERIKLWQTHTSSWSAIIQTLHL